MKLYDFTGGLSTRLASHLININQAVICNNIDMTDGTIKPMKGLLAKMNTIPLDESHFTVFNGAFVSGYSGVHFVEFDDKLYKSDTAGVISRTSDGNNWVELGLNPPDTKLEVSTEVIEFTYSNMPGGEDSDIAKGKHKYTIGYETNLEKFFKQEVEFDYQGDKGVQFYHEIGLVTNFKLYRLYEGVRYLVGESDEFGYVYDKKYDISENEPYSSFEWQSSKDTRNYVYTYYSSTSGIESAPSPISADLDVEVLKASITGFKAPTDNSVDAIRLYRMGGTLRYFYLVETLAVTDIQNQTYIDTKDDLGVLDGTLLETTDYIKPPSGLRFLTEWNSTLFAVIDSKLWFSEQGTVMNWKANNWIQFPEHITGLGATQNGLLIFARNKTWILAGDNPASYFKYLLNGSQGCITHNTVAYIDNNLAWLSLDGICISNGSSVKIASYDALGKMNVEPVCSAVYDSQYFLFTDTQCIVADFREGLRFYTLDILARGAYYSHYYDAFYILLQDSLGVHEYEKGDVLSYHYKTGLLAEGELTNYKTFKEFYVYATGNNTVSLYIDGQEVQKDIVLKQGLTNIRPPSNKTKGYYIELEFKGTGKILEVFNNYEQRQNGV